MRTSREKVDEYLSKLQRGEDCIKQFIDYTRGYLRYIAYKYLIDKSLVDDVIFLSYDKILRAVNDFDKTKNGQAWIVKITQNEAYKLNRDGGRDASLDEYNADIRDNSFSENDTINKYDIERAMARLDERESEIVERKIYMGMTVREIAAEMNIPKSTVSYILKQALKKIEKYLA